MSIRNPRILLASGMDDGFRQEQIKAWGQVYEVSADVIFFSAIMFTRINISRTQARQYSGRPVVALRGL